ncbi:hypothetical protein P3T76_009216 [Phytophthora citrophthora]|uniref:Uncharacterized protein n=1 Tax=Phytophthora citrophthora TaxID=4793 RepID=A0AAD9GGI6_9STRA|nr:hypothetical protein P3T76_009216 [Phytophthora citrophthora]
MDLLAEFMPDMGDILAAQEGALMSVISALTSQLQQLAVDNEKQAQKVAYLESTQLSMRLVIKELQNAPVPAPVVVEMPPPEPAPPDPSIVDALTGLAAKMEQLQVNVQQQVEEQMQRTLIGLQSPQQVDDAPARAMLELKLQELDERLKIQIRELRNEATDSLAEKSKQTEEAVKTQLEQLEKRFDYLSRVKMEVKEIMRRADRQEQSIEDVRVGIEMLAKSLGSDDVDSETSDEEGNETIPEEEEESAPQPAVRKAALHAIPVFRSDSSKTNLIVDAKVMEEPTPPQPESRSQSVNPEPAPIPQEDAIDESAQRKPPLRTKSVVEVSKYIRRSLRRLHQATTEPTTPVLPLADLVEPSIPETIAEPVIEVQFEQEPAPPTVVEPDLQQSEGERTTEIVIPPQVEPAPVLLAEEENAEAAEEEKEEVQPVSKPADPETRPEELPQQYRSQLATQQKTMSDKVELFRSPSSSGNLLRPNALSSVVRSRRLRRQSSGRKESDTQSIEQFHEQTPSYTTMPSGRKSTPLPPEPRIPLTKERIRELWMVLLSKLVRLARLRQLNGLNAEKSLYRRQQMSMGSRVKRLEENTTRLDESVEYLERHVQDNSSAINALDESIVELQPVVDRVQKMERTQKSQARTIIDVEEKLQEIDVEIQRLRTSVRRNSSSSSNITSAVTSAISAQLQDVSAKFLSQSTAFEASEKLLAQVSETEIPALHDKLDLSLYTIRQEAEQRANEAAQELQNIIKHFQTLQQTSDVNLLLRLSEFCDRIYHTLLGMSGAMLQSVELTKIEQSTKNPTRSSLDVGIDMLHGIFAHFITNCKSVVSNEAESEVDFLTGSAMDFQQQLDKLRGQVAMAKAAAHALETGSNNETPTPVQTSSFDDHLIFITTTKLKELEGTLITREAQKEGNQSPELTLFMHDAVVQVRSVLFLLLLHAEATNSHRQVEDLRSSHALVQNQVEEHGFALGHLDSTIALVKMMNTRLDSFMELTFSYAKEDDVKKSIQELMTANNDMRDLLTTSLEATRTETLERDGLLGEEMNQLIARVSKKLDKDELLWTQEVLERQVQNVANSSLDEHDLMDIHRRLRRKLDKNQLKAFLQNQRGQLEQGTSFARSMTNLNVIDEVGQKSAPLIGAKCISCQGELPPTKAMIKSAVRDEVQHELAKARAQKLPPSSVATFNVSNHRSLDAFKKELLLSSLQQQKRK